MIRSTVLLYIYLIYNRWMIYTSVDDTEYNTPYIYIIYNRWVIYNTVDDTVLPIYI